MKKTKEQKEETPVDNTKELKLLEDLQKEINGSSDFILTHLRLLAMVNGGTINIDDLRVKYGWSMPKVHALSAAMNHFCARGLLKRGRNSKEIVLENK